MNEFNRDEQKEERTSVFTKETFGVIFILFSAICIVSLITGETVFSKVGFYIGSFLYGIFGYFAFVVFAYLGIKGVAMLIGKKSGISFKCKLLAFLSVVLLSMLLQTISIDKTLTYSEYLTKVYNMGANGIKGSSLSGVLISLAVYPLSNLLTVVGSIVIISICLLVCVYFCFAGLVKGANTVKGRSVRSTFIKEEKSDSGVKIDGVRDYPISGVAFDDPKPRQALFVNDSQDFSMKSKKDLSNADSSTVKISFTNSGLGVANYSTPKPAVSTDDYKKKIDYIKKPVSIDIDKISKPTYSDLNVNNGTRVSDYLKKDKPINRPISDIPKIEQDITSIKESSAKKSATENAQSFAEKYASAENGNISNSAPIQQEKIEPIDNKPSDSEFIETQEDNKVENNFAGEYVEPTYNSNSEEKQSNIEEETNEQFISDDYIEKDEDFEEEDFTQEDIEETFEEFNKSKEETDEEETNEDVKPSRLSADQRLSSILGSVSSLDKANEVSNNAQESEDFSNKEQEKQQFSSNNNREEIIREKPAENSSKMFGFGGSLSQSSKSEPIKEEKPIEEASEKDSRIIPKGFKYNRPPLDLLVSRPRKLDKESENHEERLQIIKNTLAEFKINVEPQSYIQGPTVTRYEIKMPAGVSVNRVLQYDSDLRMRLESVAGVRIEAPIPGKNLVGIEVANKTRLKVGLKEIMEDCASKPSKPDSLVFALGRDIVGEAKTDDIVKGLHFLVAGSTGSGKSVALNIMIMSLIMRYSPEDVRFVLVDPKSVGFRIYEHLPHLLIDEIITDPQKTITTLTWLYNEMERRYQLFKHCDKVVSDIKGYNEYALSTNGEVEKLPRIVVVVDELADLMESCKKDLESRILALAQKARAAGIHLVLATQRPSVDIVTGTIKANLPSRIGLRLTNFNDSNTILSCGGAEKLLGNGDMLYKNSEMNEPERYQGALITDEEIFNICKYIKENNKCYYNQELEEYLNKADKAKNSEVSATDISSSEDGDGDEELLKQALWACFATNGVSISFLQRKFKLGFSRAGRLVDKMEELGFVSPNEGSKARKILISKEDFIARFGEVNDNSGF